MDPYLSPPAERLLAEWAERVRENGAQVERLRETPDGPDFYGPIASNFKSDPRRTNEPALEQLRSLVVPGETWLDIGAGGGRYALPLALAGASVIALEPSPGMLGVLREGMLENGVSNIQVVEARWPAAEPPVADVALIAHVAYDIAEIGPFIDAMEAAARRLCVAILVEHSPAAAFADFFKAAHGEPRVLLPGLPEFLQLLLARGRLFEVALSEREYMTFDDADRMVGMVRRQTWTAAGSEKDRRMEALVRERVRAEGGRATIERRRSRVGVVTWQPR